MPCQRLFTIECQLQAPCQYAGTCGFGGGFPQIGAWGGLGRGNWSGSSSGTQVNVVHGVTVDHTGLGCPGWNVNVCLAQLQP